MICLRIPGGFTCGNDTELFFRHARAFGVRSLKVLSIELLVDFPYIDLTGLFVLLQKLFGRRDRR